MANKFVQLGGFNLEVDPDNLEVVSDLLEATEVQEKAVRQYVDEDNYRLVCEMGNVERIGRLAVDCIVFCMGKMYVGSSSALIPSTPEGPVDDIEAEEV